jgi:hypothetical protein
MKTTLTLVFVVVASLLFGNLVGYKIGFSDKTKMVEQRERLLKLVQEHANMLTKMEKAAAECNSAVATLRMLGVACCDTAEKALNERDAYRKTNGKKR